VARRRRVGNIMALALLALLMPGIPMHPYQMAGVLRRTGKEQDMKIKWGSLYTVIANLEKHGLIAVQGSDRAGRRPERTLYAITDAGRAELRDWLRELVAEPEPEFPRFEAALSVIGVLAPQEAAALLETRLRALRERIDTEGRNLAELQAAMPRVFLIEAEYAQAIRQAEADWVQSLLRELADGTLTGATEWRQYHESGHYPPEWMRMLEETD
jgi:DNA-binding PadR family transcriptional regulator